jgi:putrescine transport system ATP-binding protein
MAIGDAGKPDAGRRRDFAPWTDPAARALVRFAGVTKRFAGTTAVDNVSLDIHAREFFALLGPSGCGKTTLLRLLAGFETPDTGRILLDGEDLAAMPPHRRPVNMMFQSYALFPHLSVAGNVTFGLKQEGLAREEIRARVEEMLALVKLDGMGARKPHQLSGGQRQRVALARALVKRPKVFLLDEPLAALDKKLRQDTRFELMELQEKLGVTFVVVTHDQEEAMSVSDRIAVMDRGRLVQVATPSEIYEQPNSRWVAQFVGDVNLIEGRIVAAAPGETLVEAKAGGRLKLTPVSGLKAGDEVCVALRPEKLRIEPAQAGSRAGDNSFEGKVWDIGYLGDVSIYKVRLDNGLVMQAAVANMTRMMERPIGWDDRVVLTFAPQAGVVLTR